MSYECFSVDISDKIAHITLTRPKAHNAMNRAFWNELPVIVNQISHGGAARVILISNEGKHFSAGLGLSMFAGDDAVVGAGADDPHLAAALDMAGQIAARNPLAVSGSKKMINYAQDHTEADSLDYILALNSGQLSIAHITESMMAHQAKRAPNYPNLLPLSKKFEV